MSMISEFVEKLIDRLEELRKAESDREDYSDNHDYYDDWEYAFEDGSSDGRHYAYVKAIGIIKELVEEHKDITNTNNNGWVPCSEKCPPNDTYCLITDYKGDIRIEKHLSGNEWYAGFNYVVAWQSLPRSYKGE